MRKWKTRAEVLSFRHQVTVFGELCCKHLWITRAFAWATGSGYGHPKHQVFASRQKSLVNVLHRSVEVATQSRHSLSRQIIRTLYSCRYSQTGFTLHATLEISELHAASLSFRISRKCARSGSDQHRTSEFQLFSHRDRKRNMAIRVRLPILYGR